MKRSLWFVGIMVGIWMAFACGQALAQGGGAAPAPEKGAMAAPAAVDTPAVTEPPPAKSHGSLGLMSVIWRSGWFGLLIWLSLFAASIVFVALVVDSFMTINQERIAPSGLVAAVRGHIDSGDLAAAVRECEVSMTPLGRVLKAGFMNVQEGFETVQDAVGVQADIESDTVLARVSYLSVISNTTPMLGLIGTVQGMIFAFLSLGTQEAGAAQQAMLAVNISHGLWATAVGLGISVPAAIFFFFFKNRTTRIILGMEALTLEVTKSLRNVEVLEQ